MSQSLDRLDAKALAPSGGRSYELGRRPDAALELLRSSSNPPILGADEAKSAIRSGPFIVLTDDGFTIYKPWRSSRDLTPEGAVGTPGAGVLLVQLSSTWLARIGSSLERPSGTQSE